MPADCFRRVNFFESLTFTTLAPFVLGGMTVLWFARAEYLDRSKTPDEKHAATASKQYVLLFISFCVLPACASKCFQYFGCVSYDLGDYEPADGDNTWAKQRHDMHVLAADATIDCDTDRYRGWFPFVLLMIFIYPVGTPILYFCLLYSLRHDLNPDFKSLTRAERKDAGLGQGRKRVRNSQLQRLISRSISTRFG